MASPRSHAVTEDSNDSLAFYYCSSVLLQSFAPPYILLLVWFTTSIFKIRLVYHLLFASCGLLLRNFCAMSYAPGLQDPFWLWSSDQHHLPSLSCLSVVDFQMTARLCGVHSKREDNKAHLCELLLFRFHRERALIVDKSYFDIQRNRGSTDPSLSRTALLCLDFKAVFGDTVSTAFHVPKKFRPRLWTMNIRVMIMMRTTRAMGRQKLRRMRRKTW